MKKQIEIEEIDVQSRFSESDLEFVSKEDSYQVLYSFDSYIEYSKERNQE